MITNEKIGFGCYLPGKNDEEKATILESAIEAGYRYFDTASFYYTEEALAGAIKRSGIERNGLFIASKLWINERGYTGAKEACYRSLERLGTDYLDAYFIHWPRESYNDTEWKKTDTDTMRALTELREEGVIRHIGTSNFLAHHLEALYQNGFKPEINQLELHPGYLQEYTTAKCRENGILIQAWSPLARGAVLNNELLESTAHKYGKTVSQICLIYLLQRGIMPLVKASSKERMISNLDVFDIRLEQEDVDMISCMPQTGWSGEHPDFAVPQLKINIP